MSILDSITAAPKGEGRALAKVASFAVSVEPHTNKAGVKTFGFKVYPVLSDGSAGRFGDMWVRLSEGPDALDALVDSLPLIAKTALALRARMEAAGEWAPRPKAVAPKAAAKAAATPEPTAKKSVLEDLLGDLPA